MKINTGTNNVLDKLIHACKAIIARGEEITAETIFLQSKDQKVLSEYIRIDTDIARRESLSRTISTTVECVPESDDQYERRMIATKRFLTPGLDPEEKELAYNLMMLEYNSPSELKDSK